jgi:ABC-type multidrug transport system fused ATPase/permease subunit
VYLVVGLLITTDVTTVNQFASSTPLEMLVSMMEIIGMLGVMFWLNWDFAMIALGLMPVVLMLVVRFKNSITHATREERERQSNLVAVLEQGLGSMRVVKAYGQQDLEMMRLKGASDDNINSAIKVNKVKSLFYPIIVFVASSCTAFLLWRGTALVLAGSLTMGALTIFLYYLSRFFRPIQQIASITGKIAQVTVAFERIHAILGSDVMIHQKEDKIDPGIIKGEIAFEHVDFSYNEGIPVLKDINLRIKPGERIGICGPTGSGKSTLLSLIPRFYDPCGGMVLVDGLNVSGYDLWKLRGQISYVLQDTVIFAGTILENIAYGRTSATFEEIVAAAKMANADEFISRLPNGYSTLIGDGGGVLSGGQRQRIGIARAIVRNSPILILDEPTVALDNESEKQVMEALNRLMKGRTVITVTHRLHTIREADKIYVLKDGVIAEEGTHTELIAKGGVYAGLYWIPTRSDENTFIHPRMAQTGPVLV